MATDITAVLSEATSTAPQIRNKRCVLYNMRRPRYWCSRSFVPHPPSHTWIRNHCKLHTLLHLPVLLYQCAKHQWAGKLQTARIVHPNGAKFQPVRSEDEIFWEVKPKSVTFSPHHPVSFFCIRFICMVPQILHPLRKFYRNGTWQKLFSDEDQGLPSA